jgi:predicted enzyme related to lactoylglutathione lyase
MPEVSGYAEGVPSWVDLVTGDPPAAMAFYRELLGWELDDGGGYCFCRRGGHPVAGINVQPGPEGMAAAWTPYLAVADADATAARIAAGGGRMVFGPRDVHTQGRTAWAEDPLGAVFGLWQAGDHAGATLAGEPGTMVWTELSTPDLDAVKPFYAAVFGHVWAPIEAGGVRYETFAVEGEPVGGALEEPPGNRPVWTPVFGVADTDDAVATARRLGAEVIAGPFDSPYGRYAALRDPQGAWFSVMSVG